MKGSMMLFTIVGLLPSVADAQITESYRTRYASLRSALSQCREARGTTTPLPPAEPSGDSFLPIPELVRMVEECESRPVRAAAPVPARENPPAPLTKQAPVPAPTEQRPSPPDPEVTRRLEALTQRIEQLATAQAAASREEPRAAQAQPRDPERVEPALQAQPPIVENAPAGYRPIPRPPLLPGSAPMRPGLPILPAPDSTVGFLDFMPAGWDRAVGRAIKLVDGVRRWSPTNPSVMEPLCFMAVQLEGEDVRMVRSGHLMVAYAATPHGPQPVTVLPPGGSVYITARSPRPQHFRWRCYVPTGTRIAAPPESVGFADGRPFELATDEVLELFLEGTYESVPQEIRIQRFHLEEVR